jgi:hypothetical protein
VEKFRLGENPLTPKQLAQKIEAFCAGILAESEKLAPGSEEEDGNAD